MKTSFFFPSSKRPSSSSVQDLWHDGHIEHISKRRPEGQSWWPQRGRERLPRRRSHRKSILLLQLLQPQFQCYQLYSCWLKTKYFMKRNTHWFEVFRPQIFWLYFLHIRHHCVSLPALRLRTMWDEAVVTPKRFVLLIAVWGFGGSGWPFFRPTNRPPSIGLGLSIALPSWGYLRGPF